MDVYTIHKADTMASGQNVPDDLMVSNTDFLIECFMKRFCQKKQ